MPEPEMDIMCKALRVGALLVRLPVGGSVHINTQTTDSKNVRAGRCTSRHRRKCPAALQAMARRGTPRSARHAHPARSLRPSTRFRRRLRVRAPSSRSAWVAAVGMCTHKSWAGACLGAEELDVRSLNLILGRLGEMRHRSVYVDGDRGLKSANRSAHFEDYRAVMHISKARAR
jgi:hypothetical protein